MFSGKILNKPIERVILSLISLVYFISLTIKLEEVFGNGFLVTCLLGIIILYVLRHLLLLKRWLLKPVVHGLIVLIELGLINYIYFNTDSAVSELIYMIYVADLIVSYATKYSIPTALIGYLVYYVISLIKVGASIDVSSLTSLMTRGLSFAAFVFILGYFKGTLNKNVTMHQLMKELDDKTAELEDYVLLKERNRISSEMHDTVGHTMTTSIVELEAAKMLFYEQPDLAYAKLLLASEQIRKSMHELRMVVRKMSEGENILDFNQSIESLAKEVKKHTEHNIVVDMERCEGLLTIQENILYRAIQESITNSLKHGKAQEVLITGVITPDRYEVQIIDNGLGCDVIEEGFGMHNMIQRVNSIGGMVEFSSKGSQGFNVLISLPLQVDSEDE